MIRKRTRRRPPPKHEPPPVLNAASDPIAWLLARKEELRTHRGLPPKTTSRKEPLPRGGIEGMAAAHGISRSTVRNRLSRGWTLEQALTTVPFRYKPKD